MEALEVAESTLSPGQLHDLALRFESLGGFLLGCEFGDIQRTFGAEPLGLLRWTEMTFEGLTKAMRDQFAGVGTEEQTTIYTGQTNGRMEYWTKDKLYHMAMHTFMPVNDETAEKDRRIILNRLQYLQSKLLHDLLTAQKIFVFRITPRNGTMAELTELRRHMAKIGDNTLLYVQYSDDDHPSGSLDLVEKGLMIGYVDSFRVGRKDQRTTQDLAGWTEVLRKAYDAFR